MKPSVKLAYIQRKLKLDDNKFSKKFLISAQELRSIQEKEEVSKSSVKYLCDKLNLDIDLFMNEDSIIYCKESLFSTQFYLNKQELINEDFPIEDNPRYTEKD